MEGSVEQHLCEGLVSRPVTINGGEFFSQHGAREQQGVKFRADQDHERNQIHPYQQRHGDAERSVNRGEVSEMLQVRAKSDRGGEPTA